MALAEQAFAKSLGRPVRPGEFVEVEPDVILGHDLGMPLAISIVKDLTGKVCSPSRCAIVMDHLVPAPSDAIAAGQRLVRQWAIEQDIQNYFEVGWGVCHQLVLEEAIALPGRIVAGADSHTPTCGALGALGIAIGVTELGVALATGKLWLMVPETLVFKVTGSLPAGVHTKDVALRLLGDIATRKIPVDYKVVEFVGPALAGLSIGDRAALCNMMAEAGVKSAIVRPDRVVADYLRAQGSKEAIAAADAIADAEECAVEAYNIDLGSLSPLVAVPYSPQSVKPVEEVDVAIDQAYLGSCTNGRIEDLRAAAAILKGRKVHRGVRMLVAPASSRTLMQAAKEGVLDILIEAGAVITGCSCGACFGGHTGLLAEGERCISSTNRNFRARMGHAGSEVYLASAATVAASAIAGRITDPRRYL